MIELIKEYLTKKQKGLVEVVSAGGGFALVVKKFNPEDGSELEPEIRAIDVDELKKERDNLKSWIKDIDAVLSEVEGLRGEE